MDIYEILKKIVLLNNHNAIVHVHVFHMSISKCCLKLEFLKNSYQYLIYLHIVFYSSTMHFSKHGHSTCRIVSI